MKSHSSPKFAWLAYSMAALLFGLSLPASGAEGAAPVVQTTGNVAYVSGGVGQESLEQISSMSGQFNLKLVFALVSGDYLSDVSVVITDAKGKPILDAVSDGPWFLARLPAGSYQVVATIAGKAEKRRVAIGGNKLTTIDFRWAAQ